MQAGNSSPLIVSGGFGETSARSFSEYERNRANQQVATTMSPLMKETDKPPLAVSLIYADPFTQVSGLSLDYSSSDIQYSRGMCTDQDVVAEESFKDKVGGYIESGLNFFEGAGDEIVTNSTLGAVQTSPSQGPSTSYALGRDFGKGLSYAQGALELVAGGGLSGIGTVAGGGGLVLCPVTGGGGCVVSAAGVGTAAAGAAVAAHGTGVFIAASMSEGGSGYRGAGGESGGGSTTGSSGKINPGVPKPKVSDPNLNNIVRDLYKGAGMPERIGTGSTADAIRNEILTGKPTYGKFHFQKGEQYINALNKWLNTNPNASAEDMNAAKTLLDDLTNALQGK